MKSKTLLSISSDAKTVKGEKAGYLTGILYMAPHTVAGGRNLCPFSSAGCRAVCLYSAGRGGFTNVQNARIAKARRFQEDISEFTAQICADIEALQALAKARKLKPAVRLNGTTDIQWEKYGIMERFPNVQFYDYTKFPRKHRSLPSNYHLTFSLSESEHSQDWANDWQSVGVNTAVVFERELPQTFQGKPVIDGDANDLRFLDASGSIVGLRAKGKARGVVSGGFIQKGD